MAKKRIKDELLDHDYDGIQELDNSLPLWWLYLFIFTIIFGIGYLLYYHVFGWGDLQIAEYQKEMKKAEKLYQKAGVAESGAAASLPALKPFTDDSNIAAGKAIFETRCFPCHGKLGEGGVGPNLTDDYWLHGGKFSNIVNTITNGVPAKGMVSWKGVLSPEQIKQVGSFILTLKGTNPPNAKAPQGTKEE